MPRAAPRPAKSKRPFRLSTPIVREPVLHQQVAAVLRLEIAAPGHISPQGVVWWSVDMAGYVGAAPGLRTARGCIAGVPDVVILYGGRSFFIELKASDGLLSAAQAQVGTAIMLADGRFAVARSAEEVLRLLDAWQIPRRRAVQSV